MGILFDAVMVKAGKWITPEMIRTGSVIGAAMAVEPKIGQGSVTIVALDESTTINKERYNYILNRAVRYRPGVYMREDPAGSRKERGHEGNGSAQ